MTEEDDEGDDRDDGRRDQLPSQIATNRLRQCGQQIVNMDVMPDRDEEIHEAHDALSVTEDVDGEHQHREQRREDTQSTWSRSGQLFRLYHVRHLESGNLVSQLMPIPIAQELGDVLSNVGKVVTDSLTLIDQGWDDNRQEHRTAD
jgi:hypothetical protein